MRGGVRGVGSGWWWCMCAVVVHVRTGGVVVVCEGSITRESSTGRAPGSPRTGGQSKSQIRLCGHGCGAAARAKEALHERAQWGWPRALREWEHQRVERVDSNRKWPKTAEGRQPRAKGRGRNTSTQHKRAEQIKGERAQRNQCRVSRWCSAGCGSERTPSPSRCVLGEGGIQGRPGSKTRRTRGTQVYVNRPAT
jgi:hypothetical protein